MKICYLLSNYISHIKAGMGNIHCLKQTGADLTDNPEQADIVIIHDEPPTLPLYLQKYPFLKNKYLIAYWVWETDVLPPFYEKLCSQVDEIWTPSSYTLNIFRKYADHVYRIPHLICRQNPDKAANHHITQLMDYKDDLFYFYTIADGLNPRKNLKAALSAFHRIAEQYGNQVRFVVKQYARIDESIEQLPNVISIHQPLDDQAVSALHHLCHVYVSAHCAEAWGLGISEALAQGNLAIATGFSGNMDYMNETNAFPVAYTIQHLTDEEIAFQPDLLTREMSWAHIDQDDLYGKMALCLSSDHQYDPEKHAENLQDQFGVDALTEVFSSRMYQIDKIQKTRSVIIKDRSSLKTPDLRTGMFHQLAEDALITVGREVAVDQFLRALMLYGKDCCYDLFSPAMQVPAIQSQLLNDHPRVKVHDQYSLASAVDDFQFTAWHDNQLDTYRPFMLRSRAKHPFPITILHHTLSYKELLYDKFLRLLLSRPHEYDSIICTSASSKKTVKALLDHVAEQFNNEFGTGLKYRGRYDIIPLGVDTDFFHPHDRQTARDTFKIPDHVFVMLWIGRFSAIDKTDLLPLIQLLWQLIQKNPHQEVLLLCNGRQRPGENFGDAISDFSNQLGISNHIRILDEPQNHIPLLYSAADVFVSPVDNIQESFGLSPIEAMACGLPQVVSDWDGYRDTVVHGETGFLIPTYTGQCSNHLSENAFLTDSLFDHLVLSQSVVVDMTAMQEVIQKLMDTPDLRIKMSQTSRERALEKYSWNNVILQYESLWQKLSTMAKQTPEHSRTSQSYSLPPYKKAFQHYPTRFLSEETHIKLTRLGRQLIAGQLGLPLYYNEHWKYIDVNIIKRILEGAAKMEHAGKSLSIERILQVITKNNKTTQNREYVLLHILWLLKYGILAEMVLQKKT